MLPGRTIEAQGPGNGFALHARTRGDPRQRHRHSADAPTHKELRAADPARRIDVFLGFREQAYLVKDFERYADCGHGQHRRLCNERRRFSLDATYYACGPAPMLPRGGCGGGRSAGKPLCLAQKNPVACSVGACLGCTCQTTDGRKRVCRDGPVFDYREVRDGI
ncbi:MAG: hypothetical protein R2912_11565 [Eubacteriales bacterium]